MEHPGARRKIDCDKGGNPVLEQFSEEGFVDCVLRITDLQESADYFNFHLSATSAGNLLGFDVAVRKDIKPGLDADIKVIRENVVHQGVQFLRSGPESDALLARLAHLYGTDLANPKMAAKETFTALALHKDPFEIRAEPVKIKVFGRDADPFIQENYYESFFNLDLAQGFVFWNEKDQEYRAALIRGLSASASS